MLEDSAQGVEIFKLPSEEILMAKSKKAATRNGTLQISGHFPKEHVHAFRVLAAELGKDVQELLGEGLNGVFKRNKRPNRISIVSGRRRPRPDSPEPK